MSDELTDFLNSLETLEREPFKPTVFYNQYGDCLEFVASNEPYYAERVDSLVTVHRSIETNEIVGSVIKGIKTRVKAILEETPGFKIEIKDGRVLLEHFFTLQQFAAKDTVVAIVYQQLRDIAAETHLEADLQPCLS